jgi:hypothetical protein
MISVLLNNTLNKVNLNAEDLQIVWFFGKVVIY